jgi:hypothetical protein
MKCENCYYWKDKIEARAGGVDVGECTNPATKKSIVSLSGNINTTKYFGCNNFSRVELQDKKNEGDSKVLPAF